MTTLLLCALWFFVGRSWGVSRAEGDLLEAQRLRDEAWDLAHPGPEASS